MKSALTSLGLLFLLVAGLCWGVGRQTPARQLEQQTGLVVGQPYRYRNLTIFPIVSISPREQDRFITLDEGLKAGTVEIREMGGAGSAAQLPPAQQPAPDPFVEPAETNTEVAAVRQRTDDGDPYAATSNEQASAELVNQDFPGNEVNRLLVINRSDRPLYLMPGEILLGGDQDRTIGQELVIAPTKEPVPIEVFCVEHGRWGQRDHAELASYLENATSGQISGFPAQLSLIVSQTQDDDPESLTEVAAAEAKAGKFIGSVGSLSKSTRLAVQSDKQQDKVWEEVAIDNAKSGVRSASGAFTGNYAEAEALQRLQPYMASLQTSIRDTQRVVGVIVAIDGKVESLDVFESTPLFRKLWPKLLKSYALDAANAAEQVDEEALAKRETCTRSDAVAFFSKASQSRPQKHESSSGLAVASSDNDDLVLFTAREIMPTQRPFATQIIPVIDSSDNGLGGGGMGGMMGAIHSAGYSK
jgi:hypothetical protein